MRPWSEGGEALKVTERRLHIGGHQRRAGWEIFDANAGPVVDHVGDAGDLSRFSDACFEEIYASHVLEHFDYTGSLQRALVEWRRVLAPAGRLRLSVPDLDVLAQLLVRRDAFDVSQRFQIMRMIFGGHVDGHDYHQVGLNYEFLSYFLGRAGFSNVQRVERHGIFQDTSELRVGGVLISLSVVASADPRGDGT